MTDFLQSGARPAQHPDADQLSAFAEQALPAHEREDVLLHLAACARCRDIVALSLPPLVPAAVDPVPAIKNQPVKPAWFRDWRLWLPAGAVAVAALALGLHLHTARTAPAPVETASITAPSVSAVVQGPTENLPEAKRAAAPPSARPEPAPPQMAAPAKLPQPSVTFAAPAGAAGMEGAFTLDGVESQQQSDQQAARSHIVQNSIDQLPLENRRYTPQSQGAIGAAQSANGPLQTGSSQIAQQAAPAPAPAKPQSVHGQVFAAAPPSLAETVQVETASANASVESANLASLLPVAEAPLPSRLPVTSSAMNAGRTLAVDSAGALFLSKDAGRHWKSVHAPWQGGVAKLTRPSATPPAAAAAQSQSVTVSDAVEVDATPERKEKSSVSRKPAPALFEIITANGEHWASVDGAKWKRQP